MQFKSRLSLWQQTYIFFLGNSREICTGIKSLTTSPYVFYKLLYFCLNLSKNVRMSPSWDLPINILRSFFPSTIAFGLLLGIVMHYCLYSCFGIICNVKRAFKNVFKLICRGLFLCFYATFNLTFTICAF